MIAALIAAAEAFEPSAMAVQLSTGFPTLRARDRRAWIEQDAPPSRSRFAFMIRWGQSSVSYCYAMSCMYNSERSTYAPHAGGPGRRGSIRSATCETYAQIGWAQEVRRIGGFREGFESSAAPSKLPAPRGSARAKVASVRRAASRFRAEPEPE